MNTNVEEENNSEKTKKILKISILITSIISVFVLILLIIFMYEESKTLKVVIDDVQYKKILYLWLNITKILSLTILQTQKW